LRALSWQAMRTGPAGKENADSAMTCRSRSTRMEPSKGTARYPRSCSFSQIRNVALVAVARSASERRGTNWSVARCLMAPFYREGP
jgi:hypothetical protein